MKFINEWRQFLKEENFIKDFPLDIDLKSKAPVYEL